MKKMRSFGVGFLLFHLFWMAISLLLHTRVLPSPIAVYARFDVLLRGGIFRHVAASLLRVFAGLCLSLLAGLPLGLLMARPGAIGRMLTPFAYFAYPVPKTALLPVSMLLLGLGEGSKLLILSLTTVFQIMVAARDAVLAVSPSCYHVAHAANLSPAKILWHITLPACLPALFTALRVGAGTSLAILLIVEAYGTRAGLGYLILDAWSRLQYLQMYGAVALLAVLGALLFLALDLLEQAVTH